MNDIVWSHSRLNLLINNPRDYYLHYIEHIESKDEKVAFAVGSMFHWFMEHNNLELDECLAELYPKMVDMEYTAPMMLARAMANAYFMKKDKIYNTLMSDYETNQPLKILEEYHEFELVATLKSPSSGSEYQFKGIIDLLLKTEKGWILVDYKTSSSIPNYDKYQDQLYRYIILLQNAYPDIPIYKIAIINAVKSKLKPKNGENMDSYYRRVALDYLDDQDMINVFIFNPDTLEKAAIVRYHINLMYMLDYADLLINSKCWFINFHNTFGEYGKCEFWDIYYEKPGAQYLFRIKDKIYDEDTGEFTEYRDCKVLDFHTLEAPTMNHYKEFKTVVDAAKECDIVNKEDIINFIKDSYATDDTLLEKYWITYNHDKEEEPSNS